MNIKEKSVFNVNAAVDRSKIAGYKKANFTQNAIIEHQNCASVLRVIKTGRAEGSYLQE